MFPELRFIPNHYSPPSSPPESAYGSEVETPSAELRISAILKRSFEVEDLSSSSEEVNSSKRLRWASMHSVRLLHERRGKRMRVPTDAWVSHGRLTQFLKEENAYNRFRARHHRSTLVHNENPEDVREIRAYLKKPISKMKKDRLLKNYLRLCGKQTHVFSQRSDSFQETINQYIHKYRQAIKKRRLEKLISQMPSPSG